MTNMGCFSKFPNKSSFTHKHKGYFFTARVSQVNLKGKKKVSDHRFELEVNKGLIVHVLSKSSNVSSPKIRTKKKTTQQWGLRVAKDNVFNQVRVYHERVYLDNVVRKVWFVRSFLSQHHSKFIANITFENVSQVRTKKMQNQILRSRGIFFCFFLSSSRLFDCDTALAVIVSFLDESFHPFYNISNERVKTTFKIVEIR